jgi:SPP1 family predicted phage head-tail adaptor
MKRGAGQLRRRVSLQRPTTAQDSYGEPVTTWVTAATVWASAEPLDGRELFAAQAVHAKLTRRFVVRYREDVDNTWRVLYGGRAYHLVQDPIDVGDRRAYLELLCEEPE